jgi:hypothetical protein
MSDLLVILAWVFIGALVAGVVVTIFWLCWVTNKVFKDEE